MASSRMAVAAHAPSPQVDTENLPALISRLGDDVVELFDTKISLLKVEVKEEANTFLRGSLVIAAGGVVAAIGFALLNVAVALGVSTLFANNNLTPAAQYAMGFILTGVVYLILGTIIALAMKSRLEKIDLVPNKTVEELRKDKQWLTREL
jgi:uncharacterized membrane protein YqjE